MSIKTKLAAQISIIFRTALRLAQGREHRNVESGELAEHRHVPRVKVRAGPLGRLSRVARCPIDPNGSLGEKFMPKILQRRQAHFIALLAKAAREERDALLGGIEEKELGDPKPGRGEHNPTAALGFEPLPADSPQLAALRDAIIGLPIAARFELYSLMRIGLGQYAVKDWERAMAEAERLGGETVGGTLADDVDLYDHIEKGLYETRLGA
jgi:Protein of unknown function (DUF3775)